MTYRPSSPRGPSPDALNVLLTSLDLDRVQSDAALGNSPMWFGEWALPTQFQATDEFLKQWADAQKRAYSAGAGWIVSGPSMNDTHDVEIRGTYIVRLL
jgi:hypothetical protein